MKKVVTSGRRLAWLFSGAALCCIHSAEATAQEAQKAPESGVEEPGGEIIVTAQKREERLSRVPLSISVIGGGELDKANSQSVSEILNQVPGLVATVSGRPASPNIAVRGVAAASGYNAGSTPIGYYLDSVPFAFVRTAIVPDLDVYDLSRIEVLRGPQGTLYGAGSLNGVIRVLTNDANLDDIEVKGRAVFSNTKYGGDNVRADAVVNVPLIEGKLAVRAGLSYQDGAGWIDKPTRPDANDFRGRSFRVKVNAQPTDRFSLGASVWLSRQNGGAPNTSADNKTSPQRDVESFVSRFDIYNVKASYEFDPFTISSTSSWVKFFNDGDVDQAPSGRTDLSKFQFGARNFTQEVNLTSTPDDSWKYTLGGIYRNAKDRQFVQYYVADGTDSIPTSRFPQDITYSSESWAVFGELTRYFFDKTVDLTVGLRHFEDKVIADEESRFGNVQPAQFVHTSSNFAATTPRVVLAWHPSPATNIYGSYSQGFRSGFEQLPTVTAVAPSIPAAKPDRLHNFELGAKGRLFDGFIDYDASVYYINWTEVQLPVRVLVDGVGRVAVLNAASASGFGTDVALNVHPITGLTLGTQVSWNDLTVDDDVVTGGLLLFSKGDRLSGSAKYTVGASLNYRSEIGDSGYFAGLSLNSNWVASQRIVAVQGNVRQTAASDKVNLVGASLNVEAPAGWSARLFVENLTNEKGVTVANPTSPVFESHPRPRTIGVEVAFKL